MTLAAFTLDPIPLLDAARRGRPWHQQPACPYCHGRAGQGKHASGRPTSFSAHCTTGQEIADRLHIDIRQVQRWLHGARLDPSDLNRIDRLAIAAGSHPLIIWPELNHIWGQVAA